MAKHPTEHLVRIPAGAVTLEGELILPAGAQGIVVFAHGSGSSRHSPRNVFVAQALQSAGLATLLFDLLTREEDVNYETRFDIELLTRRLEAATEWLIQQPQTKNLGIGYFGASTGASAALGAAAALGMKIGAVVSRGGRPDLARAALPHVTAPTLLIVGGEDHGVIELNQGAYALLRSEKQLAIVPGATHLFEEPGTLEEVARLAAQWFVQHLKAQRMTSSS
jgi:dienelactone hydrolase